MDIIVKLSLDCTGFLQSAIAGNLAFQRFINHCRTRYGNDFEVCSRSGRDGVFLFHTANSNANHLRLYLEQLVLPGAMGNINYTLTVEQLALEKKDTHHTEPQPDVASAATPDGDDAHTAAASAPVEITADRGTHLTASPAPAAEEAEPAKDAAPLEPDRPAQAGSSASGAVDLAAVQAYLQQTQGSLQPSPAAPEKKAEHTMEAPAPAAQIDALRAYLAKQTAASTDAPTDTTPAPAEAATTPADSAPAAAVQAAAATPAPAEPSQDAADLAADSPQPDPKKSKIIADLTAFLSKQSGESSAAASAAPDTPEPAKTSVTPGRSEPTETQTEGDIPATEPQKQGSKVLYEIEGLIGAENFKELCRSLHQRLSIVRSHHTEKIFLSDGYLFSVNHGEGYSRALELFSALMVEEGIISEEEINELTPPPPTDPDLEDKLKRFINNVEEVMGVSRTLSMDISQWIGRTSSAAFKKIMMRVFQRAGKTLVVFRIPAVTPSLIEQTQKDLDDIMAVRTVVFESFTQEELRLFAGRILKEYGFQVDGGVWPYFDQKIADEKRDGYFHGIHTVRKIAGSMIRRAEEFSLSSNQTHACVLPEMVSDWVMTEEPGHSALTELNALVGMDEVKQQLLEVVNQIQLAKNGVSKRPCIHMCFLGAAGTGKTTVARILGRLLKEKGILRIGNFYEHHGRDLCGRYVGETAIKTTAICQEAYGSVLFIDEAYSLFRGSFSSNDYGREAIDTLIAEMENHRDDMVVILAGYSSDMETLLQANSGMDSRIPYRIHFPNYDADTLNHIFIHMVKENFTYDDSLAETSLHYFQGLSDTVLQSPDFGNARFVRNLYERTWSKAALRCENAPLNELCLTGADFNSAVSAMEATATKQPVKHTLGFV